METWLIVIPLALVYAAGVIICARWLHGLGVTLKHADDYFHLPGGTMTVNQYGSALLALFWPVVLPVHGLYLLRRRFGLVMAWENAFVAVPKNRKAKSRRGKPRG